MSPEDNAPNESPPEAANPSGNSIPRELIDALPEDKRKELLEEFEQQVIHVTSQEFYSGPVVHPDIAARWDSILKGSAKELFEYSMSREIQRIERQDRILHIAEELAKHKIQFEKQSHQDSVELDRSTIALIASRERKGQWFAFIAVIAITLGSFYMIHLGHDGVGIAALVVEATGVAGVFLYQVHSSRNRTSAGWTTDAQRPAATEPSDNE